MSTSDTIRTIIISIHAPLTGCDVLSGYNNRLYNISIHAPLTGCDRQRTPARSPNRYFNPRTPDGVRRDGYIVSNLERSFISIHAPLTGCDAFMDTKEGEENLFQSTHP